MDILTVEKIVRTPEDYDRIYFEQSITGFELIDNLGYLV